MRGLDPRIAFGKHVRKIRLERRLSQEKLAELADLHRNYVGGVERGERNIAIVNIMPLARAFRVKPAKLLEPIPFLDLPTNAVDRQSPTTELEP